MQEDRDLAARLDLLMDHLEENMEKEEDARKLQETFSQFFGKNSDEMRKHSSRLKNKIYFFGFVATIFFVVVIYLTKNVNFVGI